jgi:hypothetical protein
MHKIWILVLTSDSASICICYANHAYEFFEWHIVHFRFPLTVCPVMWEDSAQEVAQRTVEDCNEDSGEDSSSSTNDRQERKCKFLPIM